MIKVGVSGANGTMGRLTIGAIDEVDDLTIDGLYAPGHDDQDILGYSKMLMRLKKSFIFY